MAKKLFIAADIEGCGAVASLTALSADGWEWQAARKWMTREVTAVCEVALDGGYAEVIVADGHGNAQNLIPDDLPRGVKLVRSWPRPLLQMEGARLDGVAACAFVGNHNASTGEGGVLAHTYHGGAIRDLRLNGVSASEGYFNAALAGELGLPVLLVTGDDAATRDAKRYAPGAELCAVKTALGWRSQIAATPDECCDMIRASAQKAFAKPQSPAPFKVEGPYRVEFEMTSRTAPEMLAYLPQFTRLGPFTVAAQCASMAEAMRLVSFVILYSPTGAIVL